MQAIFGDESYKSWLYFTPEEVNHDFLTKSNYTKPLINTKIGQPEATWQLLMKCQCSVWVWLFLLLCIAWETQLLVDPSELTITQIQCWTSPAPACNCTTGWKSGECWRVLLEGLRPAGHQVSWQRDWIPLQTIGPLEVMSKWWSSPYFCISNIVTS